MDCINSVWFNLSMVQNTHVDQCAVSRHSLAQGKPLKRFILRVADSHYPATQRDSWLPTLYGHDFGLWSTFRELLQGLLICFNGN